MKNQAIDLRLLQQLSREDIGEFLRRVLLLTCLLFKQVCHWKKKNHGGGNTHWVRVRNKKCVCFLFFPGGVLTAFVVSCHV